MTLCDIASKGKSAALAIMLALLVLPGAALAQAADVNPARTATDGNVQGMAREWQLGMQPAATPVQEDLIALHNFQLIIITVITLLVLALLIYVCLRFNARRNPVPSRVTHNTLIEVIWTTVPILILISILVPSLRLHHLMNDIQEPDMTLKVTGYQWYWGYEYPDQEGVTFESRMIPDAEIDPGKGQVRLLSVDNPVVVPVGATVRVLLTGNDVIHSWAMPAFGVKTDAVPGRLNETWFRVEKPGVYYGQCSELCGVYHAFMPIEIRAVEPGVYQQWLERAKAGNYALDGLSIPQDEPKLAANQ